MNSIKVKIIKISNFDLINQLKVVSNGIELNIITLQLTKTMVEGSETLILFKESEVIITKDFGCFIGVENVIPANIKEIKNGFVFSEILLESECGFINALITLESLKKIKVNIGEKVYALIKANEIALGGV